MTLAEYLDVASRQRWAFGKMDCVQFGLGWARERTGRPLPAFFDYRNRNEAIAALEARNGLLCVVEDWMYANGLLRTAEPEDGDIGVAPMPPTGAEGIAAASVVIRSGPWWIGRSLRGLAGMSLDGIPAWRIA